LDDLSPKVAHFDAWVQVIIDLGLKNQQKELILAAAGAFGSEQRLMAFPPFTWAVPDFRGRPFFLLG